VRLWRWARRVAPAPPASRCVTPRLQLPYPYRLFPDGHTMCHSQCCALPRACYLAVASDAPTVREQVAPHQARSQLLFLSLAVKLATSCRKNAPGERRPTGTKSRTTTKPALWAVRSTGLLGASAAAPPHMGKEPGQARALYAFLPWTPWVVVTVPALVPCARLLGWSRE